MSNYTNDFHSIISIAPVEGWRVVSLDEGTENGIWIDPMAGWLTVAETRICKRTFQPIEDQPPLTERPREVRPGVYTDFMEDASESDSFWKVLAPGQPEPTPDEIKAEHEQRATNARARAAREAKRLRSIPAT